MRPACSANGDWSLRGAGGGLSDGGGRRDGVRDGGRDGRRSAGRGMTETWPSALSATLLPVPPDLAGLAPADWASEERVISPPAGFRDSLEERHDSLERELVGVGPGEAGSDLHTKYPHVLFSMSRYARVLIYVQFCTGLCSSFVHIYVPTCI